MQEAMLGIHLRSADGIPQIEAIAAIHPLKNRLIATGSDSFPLLRLLPYFSSGPIRKLSNPNSTVATDAICSNASVEIPRN